MTGLACASTQRRRLFAPLLLAVYVAAGLVAPLAHLARHRNDHSHGPAIRPTSSGRAFLALTSDRPVRGHARHRDLAAALRGHASPRWPWSAGDDGEAAPIETSAAAAHQHAPGVPAHTHDEAAAPSPASHDHTPASDPGSPASRDHAAGSAAHFALAIVDAPAAPALPLPEDSRADAPAPPCHRSPAPTSRQVLVRGPPVLA